MQRFLRAGFSLEEAVDWCAAPLRWKKQPRQFWNTAVSLAAGHVIVRMTIHEFC